MTDDTRQALPIEREEAREAHEDRPGPSLDEHARMSGPDRPVDHARAPGVPPPSAIDDEDDDIADIEGAGSFPASDPPSGW